MTKEVYMLFASILDPVAAAGKKERKKEKKTGSVLL